jgi:hypothetical protein
METLKLSTLAPTFVELHLNGLKIRHWSLSEPAENTHVGQFRRRYLQRQLSCRTVYQKVPFFVASISFHFPHQVSSEAELSVLIEMRQPDASRAPRPTPGCQLINDRECILISHVIEILPKFNCPGQKERVFSTDSLRSGTQINPHVEKQHFHIFPNIFFRCWIPHQVCRVIRTKNLCTPICKKLPA